MRRSQVGPGGEGQSTLKPPCHRFGSVAKQQKDTMWQKSDIGLSTGAGQTAGTSSPSWAGEGGLIFSQMPPELHQPQEDSSWTPRCQRFSEGSICPLNEQRSLWSPSRSRRTRIAPTTHVWSSLLNFVSGKVKHARKIHRLLVEIEPQQIQKVLPTSVKYNKTNHQSLYSFNWLISYVDLTRKSLGTPALNHDYVNEQTNTWPVA